MSRSLSDDSVEEPLADFLIQRRRESRIRHIVAWTLIGAFCAFLAFLWLTH